MAKPSVTVSSNTLFHFTSSLDHLLAILRNEFQPHYCLENVSSIPGAAPESPEVAFPMVCFCDIPLSQTADHLRTYGRYALGLKKSWGIQHGISPVLYAYQDSATSSALNSVGTTLLPLRGTIVEQLGDVGKDALNHLFRVVSFVKPYEGKLWRTDHYTDPIRFYNEREWRYVPVLDAPEPGYGYLLKPDFLDPGKRQQAEDLISNVRLSFGPPDIRYVIVERESEILDTVQNLRTIKSRYTNDQVDLLVTRLISAEQIDDDF